MFDGLDKERLTRKDEGPRTARVTRCAALPGPCLRPGVRDGYLRATPSSRACRATAEITAGATRASNGEGMT